ncbi:alpha-galactosidase [Cohnella pontilimi]|uniref:Alpha-galactosidase n=1 Tax=Cohnella pontilimi TaxID=2564100 RepID=A0A4U0F7L5_9BACL|nr:alpha-galactosidase [Cohnella pontilimi]TJY40675.1 alpha-galactosidase [Cohnella pontilimi]
MPIHYDALNGVFHLQTPNTSYIIRLIRGNAAHVYWGPRLRTAVWPGMLTFEERTGFSPNPFPDDKSIAYDTLPQEYPGYGTGDYRTPAYQVQFTDGTTVTELLYESHRILSGKSRLDGLPATYVEEDGEAETLELTLADARTGLRVELLYSVFREHDAVARSARIVNAGGQTVSLLRALSASVDFRHADYELLHLSGSWSRERHIERRRLASGVQGVSSSRGASSHQHNPFVALLSPNASEDAGEVYGFSLVYSGNFTAKAEVDQFRTARVSLGIHSFDFSWRLEPGEAFQTPEAVLVYSGEGLGGMSRVYHRLYRERLCRGEYRNRPRPILVNNWEATYFDFDPDKLTAIAEEAAGLGIELFVLDDGWFGKRNDDTSSLGDWFVNRNKLPQGLDALASRMNGMGLRFGLWFEPEMVSPDSELYRKHPDWCLHVPEARRTQGRNQLILDLSREDVRSYIVETVGEVLASAPIDYVKWDMNRHMTEIGSAKLPPERQRETAHRYILGLYEVLEAITARFPNVLFECCSGGGGRFDPGMLYYMPQTWTSDNSDAVSRLYIQYGTSLVYPISAMGAHVTAVPNHQVHRTTSLRMRGDVAMFGNFGYELDLSQLTSEEKKIAAGQVMEYKALRSLIQFGEFYRLRNPFEGNDAAWMVVSEDRSEAFVAYFRVLSESYAPTGWLKLKGLDPEAEYVVEGSGERYGGDQLLHAGVAIPSLQGDFQSATWWLKQRA